MSFYRKLVAHCDGREPYNDSSCVSAETLDPMTTQPYRDLQKLGWTLDEDGERIYCPKRHKETKP